MPRFFNSTCDIYLLFIIIFFFRFIVLYLSENATLKTSVIFSMRLVLDITNTKLHFPECHGLILTQILR